MLLLYFHCIVDFMNFFIKESKFLFNLTLNSCDISLKVLKYLFCYHDNFLNFCLIYKL